MDINFFGNGMADGVAEMKNLLGGKGANLAEMTRICLPVLFGRDTFHVSGRHMFKNIFSVYLFDGYANFVDEIRNCTCPLYRY